MALITYMEPDFRFENDSGLLIQLVRDGWKQFNVIFSKGGSIRGGHYHKYNSEAFYIISGSFKLKVWKEGEPAEEYLIRSGDMFRIDAYVFHTFEYLEDTHLVSMYSNGVELDENTKDIWTE